MYLCVCEGEGGGGVVGGDAFMARHSFRFIYETERHNGTAELLEILGR